jgi:hypothetical protein
MLSCGPLECWGRTPAFSNEIWRYFRLVPSKHEPRGVLLPSPRSTECSGVGLVKKPLRGSVYQIKFKMKKSVFWEVTPCGSCNSGSFGGTWHILHQGDKIGELGTTLALTSNRVLSVLTRATRRNIPEDAILHIHRSENLKSYINSKWLWNEGNG